MHRSTEDPARRLAQLQQQRDEIQQQIDTIRLTGKVDDRYTSIQMRERFFEASALARQLLGDFHRVEDRFRDIARSVQEAQLQPNVRKGSLVGYVLDADTELKNSDQGRSFYAFWEYLMAPAQQEDLYTLLDELRSIAELSSVTREDEVLQHLPRHLIAAGEQVVQSNYRLAEQLRRILDERALAESRRVRELALEIKYQAHQHVHQVPDDAVFLELEGIPETALVMERALWEPAETLSIERQPARVDAADLHDLDFTRLYTQFYVDEVELQQHIKQMLELRPQITLLDLLDHYPLQKGLSELLTYCAIAAKTPHHVIDATRSEQIPISASSARTDPERVVRLPRVLYRRSAYEE